MSDLLPIAGSLLLILSSSSSLRGRPDENFQIGAHARALTKKRPIRKKRVRCCCWLPGCLAELVGLRKVEKCSPGELQGLAESTQQSNQHRTGSAKARTHARTHARMPSTPSPLAAVAFLHLASVLTTLGVNRHPIQRRRLSWRIPNAPPRPHAAHRVHSPTRVSPSPLGHPRLTPPTTMSITTTLINLHHPPHVLV